MLSKNEKLEFTIFYIHPWPIINILFKSNFPSQIDMEKTMSISENNHRNFTVAMNTYKH